jgi:hypothetical protein
MIYLRDRGIYAPPQIGPLGLWLRARHGLTFNGSTISAWQDYSPYARSVVQGTAGSQPSYDATGLNGGPAVIFNATKRLVATFTAQGQPYTIYSVVYTTADGTTNQYICDGQAGNSAVLQRGSALTTSRLTVYGGVTLSSAQASVQAAARMLTPTIVGGVFNSTSGVNIVNGVEVAGNVGTAIINNSLSIGSNAGGTGGLIGGMGEFIVFLAALDATARGRLDKYLRREHLIS